MGRLRPWLFVLLAASVVVAYFIIPALALKKINRRLDSIPGYDSHIDKLSIGWLSARSASRFRLAPGFFRWVHDSAVTDEPNQG